MALAFVAGVQFSEGEACAVMAGYGLCDSPYQFLAELLCPHSCGVKDNDKLINFLAHQVPEYAESQTEFTCASAVEIASCLHPRYGKYLRKVCPCSCNGQMIDAVLDASATDLNDYVQITSDGSSNLPHCSFDENCVFDDSTKNECAEALCELNGFSFVEFSSASNDMCKASFVSYPTYVWDITAHEVRYGAYGLEASITAICSREGTEIPEPSPEASASPLPESSPELPENLILLESDGTALLPFCSWANDCTFDEANKAECAEEICKLNNLEFHSFVSTNANFCTDSIVDGDSYYYWVTDEDSYQLGSFNRESAVVAACLPLSSE
jgi:hypothetical protein